MVYIVAEIGVNWDGRYELLEEMISKAKQCGCNAVKFQAYDNNIVGEHPERERFLNTTITKDNVDTVNEIARKIGIEWFCTPMYPEAVDFLDPFVKKFKIRVCDGRPLLENKITSLLKKALDTGKEIIISCENTPRNCVYYDNSRIKWLYCVPKYPSSLSDLDFTLLSDFDGFSNHCPNLIAPLTACILGAEIIEMHVTSDKSKNFIDNNVSFDFQELANFTKMVKAALQIKTNVRKIKYVTYLEHKNEQSTRSD